MTCGFVCGCVNMNAFCVKRRMTAKLNLFKLDHKIKQKKTKLLENQMKNKRHIRHRSNDEEL